MIELLTYPPAFGQFASSPFCVKAAYLLTMAKADWQRSDLLDPRKMPYGKLPAIRIGGQIIADSDNIRHYLEQQGADFDKGLSDIDRANSRAFIRMIEEYIYFQIVLDRWGNDTVWPHVRQAYFGSIPVPLRQIISGRLRRQVMAGLHTQGLARMSENDRLARLETDLNAITTRLWQGKFLFGDSMTAADASAAPMLAAAMASPVETALSKMVSGSEVLSGYVARVQDKMVSDGCA